MVIRISRREVLNNLIRLKDNLSELQEEEREGQEGKEERDQKKGKRTYKALLNQRTGDLRFAKKISALEHRLSSKGKESLADWKEIHLLVEGDTDHVHFEILDEKDKELHPKELSQLAWRIVSETLSVLNEKGKDVEKTSPDLLPEQKALQDLSSIRIMQESVRIEELPGWKGSLHRQAAEELLSGKPIGTYLLREGDEITLSITFHLSEEERSFVHPYLLTFVDQEEKISEILLLQTGKGWTFYSDDPDLKQPFYHYHVSIKELLLSLSHVALTPLSGGP